MVGEPEGTLGKAVFVVMNIWVVSVHLCKIVHTDVWVSDAYSGSSILIAKVTV